MDVFVMTTLSQSGKETELGMAILTKHILSLDNPADSELRNTNQELKSQSCVSFVTGQAPLLKLYNRNHF